MTLRTFFALSLLLFIANMYVASLPQFRGPVGAANAASVAVLRGIDLYCAAVFSFELLLRAGTVAVPSAYIPDDSYPGLRSYAPYERGAPLHKLLRFVFSFGTAVDLLSIIPVFVARSGASAPGVQLLSVVRFVRLFMLLQNFAAFRVLLRTVRVSLLAMSLFVMYLVVILGFFAPIIFYFESGDFDPTSGRWIRPNSVGTSTEVTPFASAFHGLWFCIVTVTTVGYGDFIVNSPGGRTSAAALMIVALVTLAMPISIIVSRFPKEFDAYEAARRKSAAARRKKGAAAGATATEAASATVTESVTVPNNTQHPGSA